MFQGFCLQNRSKCAVKSAATQNGPPIPLFLCSARCLLPIFGHVPNGTGSLGFGLRPSDPDVSEGTLIQSAQSPPLPSHRENVLQPVCLAGR